MWQALAKAELLIDASGWQVGQTILGEKVYASLGEIPHKVDMVDCFVAASKAAYHNPRPLPCVHVYACESACVRASERASEREPALTRTHAES